MWLSFMGNEFQVSGLALRSWFWVVVSIIALSSYMVTLGGVRYKVVLRNDSDEVLEIAVRDSTEIEVEQPFYYGLSTTKLRWHRLNRLRDTLPYKRVNPKLITFEVSPHTVVILNAVLWNSHHYTNERVMLISHNSNVDSVLFDFDSVFNRDKRFKAVGNRYSESVMLYDVP